MKRLFQLLGNICIVLILSLTVWLFLNCFVFVNPVTFKF